MSMLIFGLIKDKFDSTDLDKFEKGYGTRKEKLKKKLMILSFYRR